MAAYIGSDRIPPGTPKVGAARVAQGTGIASHTLGRQNRKYSTCIWYRLPQLVEAHFHWRRYANEIRRGKCRYHHKLKVLRVNPGMFISNDLLSL